MPLLRFRDDEEKKTGEGFRVGGKAARRFESSLSHESGRNMSRAITITSGKGGVGKTNISLNLALELSKKNHRTCLFDADLGLANINILLGLQPERDLKDVLLHGHSLRDIMIDGPEGVHILPGSSGVEEIADLPTSQMENLVRSFGELENYDFLIFDTSAGISRNVVAFCLASPEVVLVVTPEPTSLTDAFALLKILVSNGFEGEAKVVMNQCKNAEVAKLVYKKFRSAALKYLNRDVPALGVVYQDSKVTEAVKNQKPLVTLYPEARASKCIRTLAERLTEGERAADQLDAEGFWRRCLDLFRRPLNLPKREKGREERDEKDAEREAPQNPGQAANPPLEAGPSQGAEESADDACIPVRAEGVGEANGPVDLGGSLPQLMGKLTESILSLSNELESVRKAISSNGSGKSAARHEDAEAVIRLDLEAFLKAREK